MSTTAQGSSEYHNTWEVAGGLDVTPRLLSVSIIRDLPSTVLKISLCGTVVPWPWVVDGEKKAAKAPSRIDEQFQMKAEINVGAQTSSQLQMLMMMSICSLCLCFLMWHLA